MTKQTGTIITIVVAILTLCCTSFLCISGLVMLLGEEWAPQLGVGEIPAPLGIATCCLSVLVLVVPLLCWLFLVRGREDAVVEEYIEGAIEEDVSA